MIRNCSFRKLFISACELDDLDSISHPIKVKRLERSNKKFSQFSLTTCAITNQSYHSHTKNQLLNHFRGAGWSAERIFRDRINFYDIFVSISFTSCFNTTTKKKYCASETEDCETYKCPELVETQDRYLI